MGILGEAIFKESSAAIYPGAIVWREVVRGAIVRGGSCPGWGLSGGEILRVGNCPGGNCPGGSCPVTVYARTSCYSTN